MADYLLSIELRKGSSLDGTVGEIVVLSQAWCRTLDDVLTELGIPENVRQLTGKRFAQSIEELRDEKPLFLDERQADPRA